MKTQPIKQMIIAAMIAGFGLTGCVVVNPLTPSAAPPPWAPAHGYYKETRYIYYPQYNVYYDTRTRVYLVRSGSTWARSAAPPPGVRKQELQKSRKVYVNQPPVHNKQQGKNSHNPGKGNQKPSHSKGRSGR
jgi:hypothetical protein